MSPASSPPASTAAPWGLPGCQEKEGSRAPCCLFPCAPHPCLQAGATLPALAVPRVTRDPLLSGDADTVPLKTAHPLPSGLSPALKSFTCDALMPLMGDKSS